MGIVVKWLYIFRLSDREDGGRNAPPFPTRLFRLEKLRKHDRLKLRKEVSKDENFPQRQDCSSRSRKCRRSHCLHLDDPQTGERYCTDRSERSESQGRCPGYQPRNQLLQPGNDQTGRLRGVCRRGYHHRYCRRCQKAGTDQTGSGKGQRIHHEKRYGKHHAVCEEPDHHCSFQSCGHYYSRDSGNLRTAGKSCHRKRYFPGYRQTAL